MDQLVGVTEIATRLRLKNVQTVRDWRRRYDDFPKPVASLAMGLVWSWPEVERWARATGRIQR